MLESEEQKAQTMQDDLLKKVGSLVVNFTNQRNKSLRDARLSVCKAMKEGMGGMEAFAAEHNRRMDAMLDSSQATARDVVEKGDAGRDGADEMERALGVVGGEVRTGLTDYQHSMSDTINEQITRFERQREEMDIGISGGASATVLQDRFLILTLPIDSIRENWQKQTSAISAYRLVWRRLAGGVSHTPKWIDLCV
jgi:hypothetical protein